MNLSVALSSVGRRLLSSAAAGIRVFTHPAFVLVLLAACSSQADRLAQHMADGEKYFGAGKYREAEIEFRSALQIDPTVAAGHAQLGKTYLALKDAPHAFAEFQRALEIDDSLRDPRFEIARLYLASGDGAKAEAHARTLIERNPKDIDARLILITWLLVDQKVADAQEEVKHALALAPSSANVRSSNGLHASPALPAAAATMRRVSRNDSPAPIDTNRWLMTQMPAA
jgi:Tfp pilus assembly protein PilF